MVAASCRTCSSVGTTPCSAVGATALLYATTQSLGRAGHRVVWIDGHRTLGFGWPDNALMLRPRTPLLGLRFAELLLEEVRGQYTIEWCVKALEAERTDLEAAAQWLQLQAPKVKKSAV